MTRTQKSFEGRTSPQSRFTTIQGKGVCGVEASHSTDGSSSWRPYLIIDGESVALGAWLDGRRAAPTKHDAMEALYEALVQRGLLSLVNNTRLNNRNHRE